MLRYLYDDTPQHGTTREIVPGVLWLRMPLPMSLDHINLYLIEGDDGWWVIDTGIALGATESLWETIFSNELRGKPIVAVVATHYHPDHIGMAGWLCDHWRVPLYMTQLEYLTATTIARMSKEHFTWNSAQHLQRAGYTAAQVEQVKERWGGFEGIIKPLPSAYRRLEHGTVLTIKDNHWRVVVGSGHSPEHACLYSDALNILISGDQVIPRITSNISVTGIEPEANPLKDWLKSHEQFLEQLPADALVLPAHNTPFYGLHERLRFLIDHHEDHLLALEEACAKGGKSAIDLLPVLFKRELDDHQKGMAVGECIAHLNYLHQRGQLQRAEDGQGRYCYLSTDGTLAHRLRKRDHAPQREEPIQV